MKDAKIITVPPPQMVANMRVGNMDGFCVGEPWNHRAIIDGIGITGVTTQDIWKDHPEKVLGTTGEFAKKYPNTCARGDCMPSWTPAAGSMPACRTRTRWPRWWPTRPTSTHRCDAINQRILGRYQNGMGKTWDDPNHMKFFNDGAVNFPYLSDGMWFLTQHKRWGLLKDHPDYLAVAKQVNQIELYKQAAAAAKVSAAQERHAQQQDGRRRHLGRQGSGQVRRRLQGQGRRRGVSPKEIDMVSAVFHSPRDAAVLAEGSSATAKPAASRPAPLAGAAAPAPVPATPKPVRDPFDWKGLAGKVIPPIVGMALLVGIWALLTQKGGSFPTPKATFDAAWKLFADPFYRNGPNDQGIGWNILFSLERVGLGFGLAAVVGIRWASSSAASPPSTAWSAR